jgi:hypothetical protein
MTGWVHQTLQSVGQFLLVFLLGMALFKDWKEVATIGIANAIYQPAIQAAIAVLGNYGLAKVIPDPDLKKP